MSFTKTFKLYEENDEHFILFCDFYTVLKNENPQLRQSNLRRTIEKYYKDKIETFSCKEYVRVFSVLKYCFQHSDASKVCKSIAKQVTSDVSKDKCDNQISNKSSLELYHLIAKTSFHEKSALLESCQIDESNIETLICEHRSHFTDKEWKRICWFESHFSKSVNQKYTYRDIAYEQLINLKYSKFQSLLTFKECQEIVNKLLPLDIKEKKERLHSAEKLNEVVIFSKKKHFPYIIDDQLKFLIEDGTSVQDCEVVSFDTASSVNDNSICILIGVKQSDKDLCYNELCEHLVYDCRKNHDCDIETIYFIDQDNLQSYLNEDDGSIARFQLRDDVENKILNSFSYKWHSNSLETSFQSDNDSPACLTCNHKNAPEALATESFSLPSEWLLKTPIEVQIILEAFLNKRSLQEIGENSNYQQQKFQKLYQIYDVLQNIYNQKHIGLFQQKTTQELLIEYKNITSVFDVTSKSGATSSLKYAETRLKKNAKRDMCYYNTFLKKYPIEHINTQGECVSNASLRDCHVILMLDNLVRLQYVSDPNPSENRSKQICTLPITLQGLPLDSETTSSWHLTECDGSEMCECKQPEKLGKNDVQRVLLELDIDEHRLLTQCQRLMTWSNVRIWSRLTDNLLEYVSTGGDGCFADGDTETNTEAEICYVETEIEEAMDNVEPESGNVETEFDHVKSELNCMYVATRLGQSEAGSGQVENESGHMMRELGHAETESVHAETKSSHLEAEIGHVLEELGHAEEKNCRTGMVLGNVETKLSQKQSDHVAAEYEETEDDIDLGNLVNYLNVIEKDPLDDEIHYDDVIDDDLSNTNIADLELSIGAMSISEEDCDENYTAIQDLLSSFGFNKFVVPKLLCRHPPPATGRDDDISKIREILDDILVKMGYTTDETKRVNRIMCGPDHKIGQCLLKLMDMDPKYRSFLPEFPLLHLRKSKINILFSAYKDAGIVQLVQYMKDDEQQDFSKLVSIQHIDVATRYVKRLALALHLAFMISFTQTLGAEELESFIRDMETNSAREAADNWSTKFESYIQHGSALNATFSLHRDMMHHCESVVAVALSERLGGAEGYALLLGAVKSSLAFSFVNNASSYAPYCVKLLYHHYQSGYFHRHMKQTLYTTPFKSSNRHFASDTKREMDHIDVLKGFRSGSNTSSITCRMSLIDSLNETRGPFR